ncbi:hypothetical protein [Spirosoma oryzicola]|uniref:hypothetical protein n=1 Tax=Spirosoma oryzicola TaxID=2898794 RepID=UPI001E2E027E|nr:hypothetical protein [Spirosoma oryzicola]UHG89176.1 hypothetical protein LQ777_13075 [Spirosoma oryzicola]
MKLKSLILAFPVLCFACGNSDSDNANNAAGTGSPYLAKQVVGVTTLSVDANYQKPCNILDEEYMRGAFNIGESSEIEVLDHQNGCEFEWSGNKIALSFGGTKPFESMYVAEYTFDKLYQGKKGHESEEEKPALTGPHPEGTGSEMPADEQDATAKSDSSKEVQGDSTLGALPLTKPAVSKGRFVAVQGVGDKAVWDPKEGALHVLYNNHIINVTVETKEKQEVRKEHAQNLAEVLIEKIVGNEYQRRL